MAWTGNHDHQALLPHETATQDLTEDVRPAPAGQRYHTERHGWLHQVGVAFMWMLIIYVILNGLGGLAVALYLLLVAPGSFLVGMPPGTEYLAVAGALYWVFGTVFCTSFLIGGRPWTRWAIIAWWAMGVPLAAGMMVGMVAPTGGASTLDIVLVIGVQLAMAGTAIVVFASSPGRLHIAKHQGLSSPASHRAPPP
ncbi:MAG: hypothetical protein GF320_17215 [Armatimonadia bacterium]|nr:hypothetical protein [Armatimonadia bacterium]